MNFILSHKHADGITPIRPEEAEQLIPRISTIGELNEYEALNILSARDWAFDGRTMKFLDPLDELYVRHLHHRMFDSVWKWAGTYRQTERNIECDPREIVQRIPQLLANTRCWLENKTFPTDEAAASFSSPTDENSSLRKRKRSPRANDRRRRRRKVRPGRIHLGSR